MAGFIDCGYNPIDAYKEGVEASFMFFFGTSESDCKNHMEMAEDVIVDCYKQGLDTDVCMTRICRKLNIHK